MHILKCPLQILYLSHYGFYKIFSCAFRAEGGCPSAPGVRCEVGDKTLTTQRSSKARPTPTANRAVNASSRRRRIQISASTSTSTSMGSRPCSCFRSCPESVSRKAVKGNEEGDQSRKCPEEAAGTRVCASARGGASVSRQNGSQ